MNWYIGQEVIWVGKSGAERKGPGKIISLREFCKCGRVVLLTTIPQPYRGSPICVCDRCGKDHPGPIGYERSEDSFRPLISDSCIAELVKEQVLTAQ